MYQAVLSSHLTLDLNIHPEGGDAGDNRHADILNVIYCAALFPLSKFCTLTQGEKI